MTCECRRSRKGATSIVELRGVSPTPLLRISYRMLLHGFGTKVKHPHWHHLKTLEADPHTGNYSTSLRLRTGFYEFRATRGRRGPASKGWGKPEGPRSTSVYLQVAEPRKINI